MSIQTKNLHGVKSWDSLQQKWSPKKFQGLPLKKIGPIELRGLKLYFSFQEECTRNWKSCLERRRALTIHSKKKEQVLCKNLLSKKKKET